MIAPSHADVIFRRVPENFIGPQYSYSGNNVYESVQNADGSVRRELVGQLEAATRRSGVEAAQLSRILGGMEALSALGSVTSVLNLGVSIVGFGLVLHGLQRIDKRLQQVDRKVDALTGAVTVVDRKVDALIGAVTVMDRKVDALIGAVTVVDRKVDAVVVAMGIFDQQLEHLLDMGMAQAQATERLTQLMISFESAKVRAAVETLDARRGRVHRPEAREDVRAAAKDLATWRAWLSSRRESLEADDLQLRAEIMRHEVLVLTAEAGAWCMLGDAEHASILVDKLRQSLRAEAVGVLRRLFDEESVVGFLRTDLGKYIDLKKELINGLTWGFGWTREDSLDKILCQTIKLTNKFFISKEKFFSEKERIESYCRQLSLKILSESLPLFDSLMHSKPNVIGNLEYRALAELMEKNVSIAKRLIESSKLFNDSKINKKISTLPPTQVSATIAMIRIARSLDGMYASCLLRDMLSAEEIQNLGLDREGAGAVTVEAVGAVEALPSGG